MHGVQSVHKLVPPNKALQPTVTRYAGCRRLSFGVGRQKLPDSYFGSTIKV